MAAWQERMMIKRRTVVTATPSVNKTNAYGMDDLVGGKLSFSNAGRRSVRGGRVVAVTVVDDANEAAPLDLVLFEADPSNTTYTDQAAADFADADLQNAVGFVQITNYSQFNDNALGVNASTSLPFLLDTGSTLYGALVIRGAATYAAKDDLVVRLHIEQE